MVIDISDMVNGCGEWTNMQDIIRKTFKELYDNKQQQQNQINELITLVHSLRNQIALKPNIDDINTLISNQLNHKVINSSNNTIDNDKLRQINQDLSIIKSDLQTKASINYVDKSLHRKIDRSEVTIKQLQSNNININEVINEQNKLINKLQDSYINRLDNLPTNNDFNKVYNQFNEFKQIINDFPSKSYLQLQLDSKISRSDVNSLIDQSPSIKSITTKINDIESLLSDHDKMIYSHRMNYDENNNSISNTYNNKDQSNVQLSRGQVVDNIYRVNDKDIHLSSKLSTIQTNRLENIINDLIVKYKHLSNDIKQSTNKSKDLVDRIIKLESTITLMTPLNEIESLALIIEEQRLRIDSIITGSTTIRQIDVISSHIDEMHKYIGYNDNDKPIIFRINTLDSRIELSNHQLIDLSDHINKLDKRIDSYDFKYSNRLDALDSHIHSNKSTSKSNDKMKINEICKEIREITSRLQYLNNDVDEVKLYIQSNNQNVSVITNDINRVHKLYHQLNRKVKINEAIDINIQSNDSLPYPKPSESIKMKTSRKSNNMNKLSDELVILKKDKEILTNRLYN